MSDWTETVALTIRSIWGTYFTSWRNFYIDPLPVRVEDTTGAGDAFAAGFLYGMTHDMIPLDSGRIGAAMAAGVIGQTGPRYLGNARKLIKEKLGIIL